MTQNRLSSFIYNLLLLIQVKKHKLEDYSNFKLRQPSRRISVGEEVRDTQQATQQTITLQLVVRIRGRIQIQNAFIGCMCVPLLVCEHYFLFLLSFVVLFHFVFLSRRKDEKKMFPPYFTKNYSILF